MGVLNVTPDSFSDGGLYFDKQSAIKRALEIIEQGADILDIGGESSRPRGPYGKGAQPVPEEEEIKRTIPIIEDIRKTSDILVSIDTTKPTVAKLALEVGADIINDVSFLNNMEMAEIALQYNAGLVVMHTRGTPANMLNKANYLDTTREVIEEIENKLSLLRKKGVKEEQIIIDPGFGFAKLSPHNITLLKELEKFSRFSRPIMVGLSRKKFLGDITKTASPRERMPETLAANVIALFKGVSIIRVHDIEENVKAVKIFTTILGET